MILFQSPLKKASPDLLMFGSCLRIIGTSGTWREDELLPMVIEALVIGTRRDFSVLRDRQSILIKERV
jgi:hypothetical protein